jgi:hypothetical protein
MDMGLPMDDLIRISLISRPKETMPQFRQRLTEFWTQLLRTRPDEFEKVYAEATEFEKRGDGYCRHYLVENTMIPTLEAELQAAGMPYDPIDRDETYSKYEAVPPEWWQIEH